jgi:segregation and condensation protein A
LSEAHESQRARPPKADGPSSFGRDTAGFPPLQLSLPGFEGPIELLLRVTERDELDITTVSLVAVTAQYLEHFRAQPWADAIALGDFVATAARLLLLKSRSLLPGRFKADDMPDEGPESDAALLAALRDYRRFREAAAGFDEITGAGARAYPRAAPNPPAVEPRLKAVPVEQLIMLLQQALARFPEAEPEVTLPAQVITVEEKVSELRARLHHLGIIGFLSLAETCRSRLEVVVTFIAILHLIRDGEIEAEQNEPFGEITLATRATTE